EVDGVPLGRRDARDFLKLADVERRGRHFENALRYYSRVLELDALKVPAWVGQVRMLIGLEEYPEAELWAGKALERFKDQPELLAARSQTCTRLGRLDDARAWSDQSLRAAGESAYRWQARGEMLLSTRDTMSDYCFERASVADRDWLVRLETAEIYLFYDTPSKALAWLQKALESAADQPSIYLAMARTQRKLGLYPLAKRSYREVLNLVPNHAEAAVEAADLEQAPTTWVGRVFGRIFG
ncbi:MAG: tetratricopeptide repeat protein, partial [Planctomycetia bacterium]